MRIFVGIVIISLAALIVVGSLFAADQFTLPDKDSPEAAWWRDSRTNLDERLAWFRDARFGRRGADLESPLDRGRATRTAGRHR